MAEQSLVWVARFIKNYVFILESEVPETIIRSFFEKEQGKDHQFPLLT